MTWPLPCDIERVTEVAASDISGLMLDRSYFNDVIGSYLKYTVTVACPPTMAAEYARLYEALTAPTEGHAFVFPYNEGTISLTGRVTSVTDACARLPEGGVHWRGLRFSVAANHPVRALTLGEAVGIGRAPTPAASDPSVGDAYIYTGDGWAFMGNYPEGRAGRDQEAT